jgi:pentatricopeptide repeat protein
VYVEAMTAHSRLGAGERTLAVFQQMQAAGCTPNVLAYTIAMRACATSKLWPIALSLYADMREADGIDPDTVACNAVLVACERGGQLEEAELLLRDMQQNGPPPDVVSYNTAIATASRVGCSSITDTARISLPRCPCTARCR